jgi:multiple sugar transport system substrate-binding protein/raffinose/stachyose/melibiose transport system substrate-binding protein
MTTKRALLAGLAGAMALGTAAGAAAAAEPLTLTWLMWSGSDAETAAWQHVADLVHQQHPDLKVELQTTSFPDYWTKLPTLVASGQLPDLVSLQSLRSPGFAQIMEPLEPLAEASGFDIGAFDPSIIKGLSQNGHLLALPYDFGPYIVYYNKTMFEAKGVPLPSLDWTQAQFLETAKALTTNGDYGFAVTAMGFLPFALSDGAHYLNDAGELDFTNPGLETVFQAYADLVAKDKVAPLMPASGTPSSQIASGRFVAGNAAMFSTGPWQMINLKKDAKFQIGIAPVPAGKAGSISHSAGSGFGIAKTSEHKAEAWKALQVLTGPEAEQYLASNGRAFAARTAQQRYWYDAAAKGIDNAQAVMEKALSTAVPFKTTPNWNNVERLTEQYAPLAFSGDQTGAQVLATIQTLADE